MSVNAFRGCITLPIEVNTCKIPASFLSIAYSWNNDVTPVFSTIQRNQNKMADYNKKSSC